MTSLNSDSDIIKKTAETYLALGLAKSRCVQSYCDTALVRNNKNGDKTIAYRNSITEYYNKLHKEMKTPVLWDDLTFKDFTEKVYANTATASIVEDYKFFLNDEFQTVSNRVQKYTFTFENAAGKWYVTSVKTNDPIEDRQDFSYAPINADKTVSCILTNKIIAEKNTPVGESDKAKTNSSALSTWGYNRDLAASYGNSYYNRINSNFGEASEDCQNFASQCVWAGFGGQSQSLNQYPIVTTNPNGGTWSRVWRHNYYYQTSHSSLGWTWDNVGGFASMVSNGNYYNIGPMGTCYYGNLLYADVGDVIDYTQSGTPAWNNLDHAMVITNATGNIGYRSSASLYIAAHNRDTNYANEPLTEYYHSPSDSRFTTVHIECANYPD